MRLPGLLIGLLVACVFLRTLSTPVDFDLWFDIRMGREIAVTGAVPHHETFLASARTFETPYWVNDEWGFAWLSWLVYSHFGLPGLAVAKSVVLALLALFLCLGCRQAGLPPWAVVLLVSAELWMVQGRFMFRPQLLTDVFLAVQTWLALRQEKSERVFLPWAIGGLYCLWSNMHGGIVAGLAVLGALWVGSKFRKVYLLALVAALIGGLLRPGTWQIYAYVTHLFIGRTDTMENNLEWAPMRLEDWLGSPAPYMAMLLVGLILAGVKRKLPPGHLLACAGMTLVASRHNRALGELGACSVGFVARAWSHFLPDSRPTNLVMAALLAVVLCLGPAKPDWNRTDFPEDVYPEGALRYLSENPVPGTLFNSYHLGGFLVFRNAPAVIHGMTSSYPTPLLEDYYAMIQVPARQRELVQKYDVGAFLLHYSAPWDAHAHLAERLWRDPEWALAYWDDGCVLYVKRPLAPEPYSAVNPALRDPFPLGTEKARPELERAPDSALTWRLRGQLELREGRWESAIASYDRAIELAPGEVDAWLGRAQARLGRDDAGGALNDLKQAVALRPDSGVAHYNLAVLYLKTNRPDEARSQAEKALRLDFEPARKLLENL